MPVLPLSFFHLLLMWPWGLILQTVAKGGRKINPDYAQELVKIWLAVIAESSSWGALLLELLTVASTFLAAAWNWLSKMVCFLIWFKASSSFLMGRSLLLNWGKRRDQGGEVIPFIGPTSVGQRVKLWSYAGISFRSEGKRSQFCRISAYGSGRMSTHIFQHFSLLFGFFPPPRQSKPFTALNCLGFLGKTTTNSQLGESLCFQFKLISTEKSRVLQKVEFIFFMIFTLLFHHSNIEK